MESARKIVVQEWNRRRLVKLDTAGGWHQCNRCTCAIRSLTELVCLEGQHIIQDQSCCLHPGSTVMHVNNLYACEQVGAIHVCSQSEGTCTIQDGKCIISGKSCVFALPTPVSHAGCGTKRAKRKQSGVHTNLRVASILMYNLLFSKRRIESEIQRAQSILDHGRRQALRYVKTSIRQQTPMRYQTVVNIINQSRQTVRNTQYLLLCNSKKEQEELCKYYANILVNVWPVLISFLPSRNTFDCTCAALLYSMRKGLAYDGLYAIPPDRFLLYALPDAHSIKDIGISRRAFTQARNALYGAVREIVSQRQMTVENFAFKFKKEEQPHFLTTNFASFEL